MQCWEIITKLAQFLTFHAARLQHYPLIKMGFNFNMPQNFITLRQQHGHSQCVISLGFPCNVSYVRLIYNYFCFCQVTFPCFKLARCRMICEFQPFGLSKPGPSEKIECIFVLRVDIDCNACCIVCVIKLVKITLHKGILCTIAASLVIIQPYCRVLINKILYSSSRPSLSSRQQCVQQGVVMSTVIV